MRDGSERVLRAEVERRRLVLEQRAGELDAGVRRLVGGLATVKGASAVGLLGGLAAGLLGGIVVGSIRRRRREAGARASAEEGLGSVLLAQLLPLVVPLVGAWLDRRDGASPRDGAQPQDAR